ncbi:pentapeptide repeat-containing protein [Synechocystis sp. B12]|nr:pentapeptide repeat-containing protein [Synechocystis sp. B12]
MFTGADLRNVNFQNSHISGINLAKTIMPDGSVHP